MIAGLLCAACAGAQTFDDTSVDTSKCEIVSGQTEIEGTLQSFVGRACRQPNGVWVFVSEYAVPDYGYWYSPSPWAWGTPVLFGSTVVFVDRFHRFHHFHHFHHFHDSGRMSVAGRPHGMHSWGAAHAGGWAGGMRRN